MGIFNKIFQKNEKKSESNQQSNLPVDTDDSNENTKNENKSKTILSDKIDNLAEFGKNKFVELKNEYEITKYKLQNLLQTNHQLGLKHLEQGNMSSAIFRFRFIKFFWPEFYEAYYQLAYCLIIKKRYFEAKKILAELTQKNPDYQEKAQQLINSINQQNA